MRWTALILGAVALGWPQDISKDWTRKPIARKAVVVKEPPGERKAELRAQTVELKTSGHELSKCAEGVAEATTIDVEASGASVQVEVESLNEAHAHVGDRVIVGDQVKQMSFEGARSMWLVENAHTLEMDKNAAWELPPNVVRLNLVSAANGESKLGVAAISDAEFVVQVRVTGEEFRKVNSDGRMPSPLVWTEKERLVPRFSVWLRGQDSATLLAVLPNPSNDAPELSLQMGGQLATAPVPPKVRAQVPATASGTAEIRYESQVPPTLIYGKLKRPFKANVEQGQAGAGVWKLAVTEDLFAMVRARPAFRWTKLGLRPAAGARPPAATVVGGIPIHVIAFSPELQAGMTGAAPWMAAGVASDMASLSLLNKLKPITDMAGTLTQIFGPTIITNLTTGGGGGGGTSSLIALPPLSGGPSSPTGPTSGGGGGGGGGNSDPKAPPLPKVKEFTFQPPEAQLGQICLSPCRCGLVPESDDKPKRVPGGYLVAKGLTITHDPLGDGCGPCKPVAQKHRTINMKIVLENADHALFNYSIIKTGVNKTTGKNADAFTVSTSNQQVVLSGGANILSLNVVFNPPGRGRYEGQAQVTWHEPEYDHYDRSKGKWVIKYKKKSATLKLSGSAGLCQVQYTQLKFVGDKQVMPPITRDGGIIPNANAVAYYTQIGGDNCPQTFATQVTAGERVPATGPLGILTALDMGGLLIEPKFDNPPRRTAGIVGSTDVTQNERTLFTRGGTTPPIAIYNPAGFEQPALVAAQYKTVHFPTQEFAQIYDGSGQTVGSVAQFSGIPPEHLGDLQIQTYDSKGSVTGRAEVKGGAFCGDLQGGFDKDSYPANSPATLTIENIRNHLKSMELTVVGYKAPTHLQITNQTNITMPPMIPLTEGTDVLRIQGRTGPQVGAASVSINFVRAIK